MSYLDWTIVGLFFSSLFAVVLYLSRFNRSVADFLAANRSAGRYMLTISQSSSSFGAISLVAVFEMYYKAGFSPVFWATLMIPAGFIISVSGWVIYRYRETRVMTLAQFFELRYSKRLRIFMGLMAFISGVLNFGIFPAITAHFFIYFCNLPESFAVAGLTLSTFQVIMALELGAALTMTLGGGQIAVMISDFIQGQFINLVLLAVLLFLVWLVKWNDVCEVLVSAPPNASLINPFKTSGVKDFNFWYYAIALVGSFYGTMAWQGSQGFNACAKNPHEARMGSILGQWRGALTGFLPAIAAIAAMTVMHHSSFSGVAETARASLASIPDEAVRNQMTVPTILSLVFPIGLMGVFAAAMMSATLATDSSYLHSWGSIFIQDVVLPIYGKPLTPKAHVRILRYAIIGVAVFAFFFSQFFRQTEHILLFMAATGAIFVGGAGSVIIGGLYWNKGTTAAAWVAMIVGSTIAVTGMCIRQFNPAFPFNSQEMYFFAMVASVSTYVLISLIQNREFDLDRILHRGKYRALLPESEVAQEESPQGLASLAPGPNFTSKDRLIYWLTMGLQVFFFGSALTILLLYAFFNLSDQAWLNIWYGFICVCIVKAIAMTIWFLIGGAYDFRDTLNIIKNAERNQGDDGTIVAGHNAGEPSSASAPKQSEVHHSAS